MHKISTIIFSYRLSAFLLLFLAASCGHAVAQGGLKGGILSKEFRADSLAVEREIKASRDIHREAHDEDLEYQHAENAVAIALKSNNPILYARALDNLGLLYRYHQKYQEALAFHIKAFDLVKELEDAPVVTMICANNAGVAARYAQEYDKAVLYYMEALKVAEAKSDLRNIAIACNGLGNTLLHMPNRSNDAINYFERALEAEKARENTLGMAMNYLSMSDYYNEREEYRMARQYLEQLLEININRKDTFGLAITYQYFGLNYVKEGKSLGLARDYYFKSQRLFIQLENKLKQAELLLLLGEVERMEKNYTKAIDYYEQSLPLALESSFKGILLGVYAEMSLAYEEQSNDGKALEYYKLAQSYKDSIALKEQETAIAAIEKRYAFEKKEAQIALLEKDQAIQQAQIAQQEEEMQNQKIVLILLIVGLIAIGSISLLLHRNNKIKKKSNRLLLKSNQRILQQHDEISLQKDKIEETNRQLEQALVEVVHQQKESEKQRIKLIKSRFENKIQSLTLQSLESQMNPHFLFNGMNAVRWLVIKNQNKAAIDYLNTFAQLLRLSLTSNRKEVIPLKEEIRTTTLYLEIEKLRFSSEFTFSVNISPEVDIKEVMVPPKILQPLAENAIKHGLLPSKKPEKKLEINIVRKDNGVSVEVVDNGDGFEKDYYKYRPKQDGTHLGLKLIRERLSIYNQQHNNAISFSIEALEDVLEERQGTRAAIYICSEKAEVMVAM